MAMLKKIAVISIAVCTALAVAGYVMYLRNTAPVTPPIPAAEATNPSKPFVVKLHAQWCPVCVITTSVWSQIQDEYSGRVNFLVLDFTDDQTTDASRAAAERVGLGRVFEETGSTGVVLVVDGRTKDVTATIAGSRDFAEYRAAIDAALASPVPEKSEVSRSSAPPPKNPFSPALPCEMAPTDAESARIPASIQEIRLARRSPAAQQNAIVVAFLNRSDSYLPVYAGESGEFICLVEKGRRDYSYEVNAYFTHATDAIYTGVLEKAGGVLMYRNGRFMGVHTVD